MTIKNVNRREFITECGLKVAGTGLLLNQLGVKTAFAGKEPASAKRQEPAMEYRTLGRTGLKVSAVSFGVMRLKEPGVLFKALDLGINYFDTAHSYQNGNNEKMLGKALKEYGRNKVFVATKIQPFRLQRLLGNLPMLEGLLRIERETLDEMMETSLKRLQTDYVDVLMVHSIMDRSWLSNEAILAFLEKLKKDGKARFVGVSVHDPRAFVDVVDQASSSTMYDVVLASLNFKSPPEHIGALRRARKANIGIVAMKTQAGGYTTEPMRASSPHQAALKWVVEKDFVDCAIPGMVNIEQVVENVGVVGKKVGWSDRKALYTYYSSIKHHYCVMCGKCASTCTNNVEINTINRALMYCEGYSDFELGRETYLALDRTRNGLACLNCSSPTCRCANGIKLAERMRHAHSLFA
jgi:aryl-alcohol dehydrogenase-like predicted oxidoreductase